MTLAWHITRRFIAAWLGLTLLLGLLFSFIEFFEKLARVKQTTVQAILHFLGLNLAPTLVGLLPVGLWLATLVLLRELSTGSSWDFYRMLGFVPRRLARILCVIAGVSMVIVLVVRECVVLPLGVRAERFKQEQFKRVSATQQLLNRWFELAPGSYCFVGDYDLQVGQGHEFLLVRMSRDYELQDVMRAGRFTLVNSGGLVILHDQVISLGGNCVEKQLHVELPALQTQLRLQHEMQNIFQVVKNIAFRQYLSTGSIMLLYRLFLQALLFYLGFFLYPLMTLLFFMWGSRGRFTWLRWVGALAPYPLLVGIGILIGPCSLLAYGTAVMTLLLVLLPVGIYILLGHERSLFLSEGKLEKTTQ